MGHSRDLFLEPQLINEEFECTICHEVLKDVTMLNPCEHVYCNACIDTWLKTSQTCPVDRTRIQGFKSVQRVFLNVLNSLKMRCPFTNDGCRVVLTLGELKDHDERCDFNPENHKGCASGCGCIVKKCEIKTHSCVKYLKRKLAEAREELDKYKAKYGELTSDSDSTPQDADEGAAKQGPSTSRTSSRVNNAVRKMKALRSESAQSPKRTRIDSTPPAPAVVAAPAPSPISRQRAVVPSSSSSVPQAPSRSSNITPQMPASVLPSSSPTTRGRGRVQRVDSALNRVQRPRELSPNITVTDDIPYRSRAATDDSAWFDSDSPDPGQPGFPPAFALQNFVFELDRDRAALERYQPE